MTVRVQACKITLRESSLVGPTGNIITSSGKLSRFYVGTKDVDRYCMRTEDIWKTHVFPESLGVEGSGG